jgi:invasion protein IalB
VGWLLLRKLVIGVGAEYTLMPEPQSENTFWSKEISSCEKILPRLGSSSATAILLIAAWIGTSHAAAPQGAVKSVHGDWQVRCDSPPGTQENQCALVQSVTAEDRPDVGLIIIVVKRAGQNSPLLRVVAPMGVMISAGLGLKIDGGEVGRAGFIRCLPNGCVAEVVMDDSLLKQFRSGQTATFIIFQTPEEGIGFPINLKGFGEGLDSLP